MRNLYKVNSKQFFATWKNVSMGLLIVILVTLGCRLLPFYFSPVVALGGSAILYTLLYQNKLAGGSTCGLMIYALFFCMISFSFISILANVLYIWGLLPLPDEFIFFNDPYFPTLWMNPICFITLLVIRKRRKKLRICVECRMRNGTHSERGAYGAVINKESDLQLKNLSILFGVLTVIVWTYYLIEYEQINTNGRDRYVFFWITLIGLIIDEIYFFRRYLNLYLDLKEHDEVITPEELETMTAKKYIRYYVICGNYVYMNRDMEDVKNPSHRGIDTPFFITTTDNGVSTPEVRRDIKEMTGCDGELKFFYGKRSADVDKISVLRFFYFLDGDIQDYPELNRKGEWMDFNEIKRIYSHHPEEMDTLAVLDLTRLATIMVTQKLFNEEGIRKMKLKNYIPTFDLHEVRDTTLNFQDDKWIKISHFNSDTKFFKQRRWLRNMLLGKKSQTV